MKKITARNDEIYLQIEKFKKYEYTNCIAMEMKKRSSDIKEKDKEKDKDKEKMYKKDHTIYNKSETIIHVHNIKLSKKCTLHDYIFNIFPSLYDYLQEKVKSDNNIKDKLELNEKILNNPIPIKDIIKDFINNKDILYNSIMYKNDKGKMEKLTKTKLIKIIEKTNFKYTITPKLGYDIVVPYDYKFVRLDYINLALPLDELIAFITEIKDDFDTDKLILDTPSEIMNKSYIDKEMCTKNDKKAKRYKKIKDSRGKEINTYDIINTNKKAADMFYIYDQKLKNHTKEEIIYELKDYHETYDKDRLNRYLLTAEEYIDNKYYINLIK